MKTSSFFETIGVIALTVLFGIALIVTSYQTASGQCPGGYCGPSSGACSGGVCPAPSSVCPGGVCPVLPVENVNLDAVLRVRVTDGVRGGKTFCSKGSGAVVRWGEAVVFLTAHHVIKDGPNAVEVRYGGNWYPIQYVYADPVFDFAIYTAPEVVEPLDFGVPDGLQNGCLLLASGFGGNEQKAKFAAIYKGMMRPQSNQAADWMKLEGAAIGGDSGGPILSTDGTVVGVLWGSSQERNETLATHGRRIAAAIDRIVEQQACCVQDGKYRQCQYIESFGSSRTPQPQIIRSPGQPGGRIPVPESASPPVIVRPVVPPAPIVLPTPVPIENPITVNMHQDQSVVSVWVGELSGKVDSYGQRLDATEAAVGQAIGQAAEIVMTTNGRLTGLETLAKLDAAEKEKLPGTIAAIAGQVSQNHTSTMGEQLRREVVSTIQEERDQLPARVAPIADSVVRGYLPTVGLVAAGVCIVILLYRRRLDNLDGSPDGRVDVKGLIYGLKARLDARDGSIDRQYADGYGPMDRDYGRASVIARQQTQNAKMQADLAEIKAALVTKTE